MEKKCYPNFDESLFLRSCKEEIRDPIQGKITGTIPKWIHGDFIGNGPGTLIVGDDKFEHIFDSLALLRKFTIKDGNATYQCRFLESNAYKINNTAQRIVTNGFGTSAVPDPCHTIFQRFASKFVEETISDNSSPSIYPLDDELYAFGEIPIIHRINKDSLETIETVNIAKKVVIVHHTSHPHIDQDGSVYNLATTAHGISPQHNIVCFPSKAKSNSSDKAMYEKAKIIASIPVRWPLYPTYMHSFGMTENYFIIVEQPWCLSVLRTLICPFINQTISSCFTSYKNEMTQFSVINRKTGEVRRFHSKAFFYFHIINQYESSNNIVIDVCTFNEALVFEYFFVKNMMNTQKNPKAADDLRSRPLRFILPLEKSVNVVSESNKLINGTDSEAESHILPRGEKLIKPELLCDIGCETPTIYYKKYLGREYQYFYSICMDVDAKNPGMLIKVDVKNKSTKTWYENNCFASEPIFVPKPNSKEEDDGVLLSGLFWGGDDTNRVGLVVLDAKTMKEIGKVEFKTPSPIPKCFHGWFAPHKDMKL